MKEAIEETNRRRKIQNEYNLENGIDPKSVVREISEEVLNFDYGVDIEDIERDNSKKHFTSTEDIEKEISKLKKEISKLSAELNFEKAIEKRDEMKKLEKLLFEF
jgi:excinuclease ABC subunit B